MNTDWLWAHWGVADIERVITDAIRIKREALEQIKHIPASDRTFENTIAALEHASYAIADCEQTLQLLVAVHPDAAMRTSGQEAQERITAANVTLDYDPELWRAYKEWEQRGASLEPRDQKLAHDIGRDLRRMGFDLAPEQFALLKTKREELQNLEQAFEKGINDWEDAIEVTREELAGLSERYIDGLQRTADGRFRVTLQYPDLFPFMQMADSDERRRELAEKNLRKGGKANLERLARMITLRNECAALLGYPTHAEYATEVRMAGSGKVVHDFLTHIIQQLQPGAHQDLRDLVDIKRRTQNLTTPAPIHFYEIAYWSHRLQRERYELDQEQLKEYFPLDHVMKGVLEIYQHLLGVKFQRLPDVVLWHADAHAYAVHDTDTGAFIGNFILDLHPRQGKYGHAAAFPVQLGRHEAGGQTTSIIALVCNFPRSTEDNPSLLSHDEVETLLHEFGHVMHALLSTGKYQRQNGFGVPLDFVEALSQMLEHWAWDRSSVQQLSCHYRTGQVLPDELFAKIDAAKRHLQATYYLAQAVRSLYDLQIHSAPAGSAADSESIAELYRAMKLQYEHIELPADSIFAAGWSHMADYDAGYYGYLWSKVYASDMYTRFASHPLDAGIGHDYRTKVLEPGASQPELDLVRAFLGREPSDAAFLAEIGIS